MALWFFLQLVYSQTKQWVHDLNVVPNHREYGLSVCLCFPGVQQHTSKRHCIGRVSSRRGTRIRKKMRRSLSYETRGLLVVALLMIANHALLIKPRALPAGRCCRRAMSAAMLISDDGVTRFQRRPRRSAEIWHASSWINTRRRWKSKVTTWFTLARRNKKVSKSPPKLRSEEEESRLERRTPCGRHEIFHKKSAPLRAELPFIEFHDFIE